MDRIIPEQRIKSCLPCPKWKTCTARRDPNRPDDGFPDNCPLPDAPVWKKLVDGIKLELLAEWIAIEHNETRLQSQKYLEEAQHLADWLQIIGYRLGATLPLYKGIRYYPEAAVRQERERIIQAYRRSMEQYTAQIGLNSEIRMRIGLLELEVLEQRILSGTLPPQSPAEKIAACEEMGIDVDAFIRMKNTVEIEGQSLREYLEAQK